MASLKTSEATFTRMVIQFAKLHGWGVTHFRPCRTSKGWRTPVQGDAGFPDLVLVKGTRVVFAELKSSRGVLSPEQQVWRDALCAVGSTVEWYLWRVGEWPEVERVLGG